MIFYLFFCKLPFPTLYSILIFVGKAIVDVKKSLKVRFAVFFKRPLEDFDIISAKHRLSTEDPLIVYLSYGFYSIILFIIFFWNSYFDIRPENIICLPQWSSTYLLQTIFINSFSFPLFCWNSYCGCKLILILILLQLQTPPPPSHKHITI